MKVRRALLKDAVSVEPYSGQGAYGPEYDSAQSVYVHVESARRLVRDMGGREVISEITLYVHPDDIDSFPPESRLTVAGRESTVIVNNPQSFRGQTSYGKVACS